MFKYPKGWHACTCAGKCNISSSNPGKRGEMQVGTLRIINYSYGFKSSALQFHILVFRKHYRHRQHCGLPQESIVFEYEIMDQGRIWPLTTHKISGVIPLKGDNSKIKFSKSTDVEKQSSWGKLTPLSSIRPCFWAKPTPSLCFWLILSKNWKKSDKANRSYSQSNTPLVLIRSSN